MSSLSLCAALSKVNFVVYYKTTLKEYNIEKEPPHRALEDAKLMYQLFIKMGLK